MCALDKLRLPLFIAFGLFVECARVNNTGACERANPGGQAILLCQESVQWPNELKLMSLKEKQAEFHRLYHEDLPYAKYIRGLAEQSEATKELPKMGQPEWVYTRLVEALRYLTGEIRQPIEESRRRYIAASYISSLFEFGQLGLEDLNIQFHREFFQSPEFQESNSIYHDTAVDLWQRYTKSDLKMPYQILLSLNYPEAGRPKSEGRSTFYTELNIGDLYAQLGEHGMAARWYEKVPPVGLGPLKAADAYFAAREYEAAERLYRYVLDHLDEWIADHPQLQQTAIVEPLELLNSESAKAHIAERLAQIKQGMVEAGDNDPASTTATQQGNR